MNNLTFGDLPRIAQIGIGVTFFNSWVLFEEVIVDRYGLWKYMPFYRVADPCIWDLSMALLITTVTLYNASKKRKPRSMMQSLTPVAVKD